jgi:hypothetical protein
MGFFHRLLHGAEHFVKKHAASIAVTTLGVVVPVVPLLASGEHLASELVAPSGTTAPSAETQAPIPTGPLGDSPDQTAKIDRALDSAPVSVLEMIDAVLATPGGRAHAADFFDGAHIVIEDDGALYDQGRALPDAVERMSSHASLGKQYQVAGDSTGPILFGRTPDGKGTWLQLEGHRADLTLGGAPDLIPHMIDYVKYKLTGKNQSRFGSSSYTDKHPLVLDPAPEPPVSKSCGLVGALAR